LVLCSGILLSRIHANPKTVSKHTAPSKSVANSQSRVTKTVQKKSAQEKAMSEKDKDPKGAKEAESSSKEVMEVDADEAAQGLHNKGAKGSRAGKATAASGNASATGKRRGRPAKAAQPPDTEQIGLGF
jgi:hypothetical protein